MKREATIIMLKISTKNIICTKICKINDINLVRFTIFEKFVFKFKLQFVKF